VSQPLEFEASPAERRRLKVRGAILEAAERVFSEEGEAGLSIRRLADEIDYSPSAIYKYFGSKEELVDELKEAFFGRLMERVDRTASRNRSFEAHVQRCFETYIDVATERPHHYLAAFSSLGSQNPNSARDHSWEAFQDTNKGRAFSVIVTVVQDGQAQGVFDPSLDPFLAAKSLWSSMHGLAMLLIHMPGFPGMIPDDRKPQSNNDFIAFHVRLMVRGLKAGSPSSDSPTGTNGLSHV
jgi:AcrR family transcriptional regulator